MGVMKKLEIRNGVSSLMANGNGMILRVRGMASAGEVPEVHEQFEVDQLRQIPESFAIVQFAFVHLLAIEWPNRKT